MKRFFINTLKFIFDNQIGQKFLQKVHLLVLYMQNYGLTGDLDHSGELHVIKRIGKELNQKKDPVIFDVGANVGKYISYLDKQIDANYLGFCFEPSKSTFELLKENTKTLKNVQTINKGLGDQIEILTLYSNDISNTQSSILKRDMSHWEKDYNLVNEENVEITTLDSFCEENNIDFIDFMKIDVEGYEMNMFRGASHFIKNKKIGAIQFELGVASVDGKYFFKDVFYLLNENYKIYRITPRNLFEIKKYSEQYEVFLTTNYLAILR